MPLYLVSEQKLTLIKENRFALEKNLQKLVEGNLTELLNLKLVSSEIALNELRVDTLAFDEEVKAFVIIEYKLDRSFSVIDQGYAYLSLLLNNKADFILEYNKKNKANLEKGEVDWSQSRVIFISSAFTKYQRTAIGFQDLPIELWEARLYENGLFSFTKLETPAGAESIKTVSKGKTAAAVTKEIQTYTLDDHFKRNWEKSRELFDYFSQRVLNLDPRIVVKPVKYYIGFNINNQNMVAVTVYRSKLLLELLRVRPQDLCDPEKRTKYRRKSYEYFHKHITKFDIRTEVDIDYAISLVKQVHQKYFA